MTFAQVKFMTEIELYTPCDSLLTFVARLEETDEYIYGNIARSETPSACDLRETMVNFIVQQVKIMGEHDPGSQGGLFNAME